MTEKEQVEKIYKEIAPKLGLDWNMEVLTYADHQGYNPSGPEARTAIASHRFLPKTFRLGK